MGNLRILRDLQPSAATSTTMQSEMDTTANSLCWEGRDGGRCVTRKPAVAGWKRSGPASRRDHDMPVGRFCQVHCRWISGESGDRGGGESGDSGIARMRDGVFMLKPQGTGRTVDG